jgi:glycosyltransferase involved in cell wall biosynthesis
VYDVTSRTLLVVSARVDETGREAIAAGRWPRKDFFELQGILNADVVDHGIVQSHPTWRMLSRVFGASVTQALIAFTQHHTYDRVITDGEHIGIPLALLLRLSPRRVRHLTIGHLLSTRSKRRIFRWLRPQQRIDIVALHASQQRRIAVEELDVPASSIRLVPYGVDSTFWTCTTPPRAEPLICAVGLEYRDYPTLIDSVRGLPVELVIAAGSRWSRHRDQSDRTNLPPNVTITSLNYEALRRLYADARFAIVPLRQVANQAGITVILEAMSMSRAVVVTATTGQRDAVRGRMVTAGGIGTELHGGPNAFGVTGPVATEETGLYVPPADPAALRRAITHLLEQPAEAERMGRAGRRLVEEEMNLDRFVERLAALATGSTNLTANNALKYRVPAASLRTAPSGE